MKENTKGDKAKMQQIHEKIPEPSFDFILIVMKMAGIVIEGYSKVSKTDDPDCLIFYDF